MKDNAFSQTGALPVRLGAVIFIIALLLSFLTSQGAEPPTRREWTVGGVSREALVYAPAQAKTNAAPVIFAFHGHGGTMRNAANTFGYHKVWPEAIVVYPQGLNTPGRLTDPEGNRPGWQSKAGDLGDRDLKFFDAILASLEQEYRVDTNRLFATGHSNGGAFTYLLWSARGKRFTAFAPSGAVALPLLPLAGEGMKSRGYTPKPVLHVAGETDPLVKFAWQKATMSELRRLNQCGEGEPWEKWCTLYPSKIGAPVVTFIHPGGHQFPAAAPAVIVRFFKESARLTSGK
jgi:polyhydroxybutyrate depolymerase